MAFTPTRLQRFLRALGFDRGAVPDLPVDVTDRLPCWATTETHIRFDFLDRVRLLVTGRLFVKALHAMEHDPGEVVTRSAVSVRWTDARP